jgi:hypothetical protein
VDNFPIEAPVLILASIQASLSINMVVEKYVPNNGIGRVFNGLSPSNNVDKSKNPLTLVSVVLEGG